MASSGFRGWGLARCRREGELRNPMETVLVVHEVDDVDHWAASPKREEFFAARGMSVRAFRSQEGSNRVAVLIETPDMETLQASLETEEAAAAMQHDGVRPETLQMFVEG